MKSTFYNYISLIVLQICLFSAVGYSQCTTIVANGGNAWTDFTAFAPPCDDGTGCTINEITAFEVFASEAYIFDDLTAGVDYTFSMCNGPGAGTWVPEFAIQNAAGEVVASGEGDGDACSITWTAISGGTYIVIINELGMCGTGANLATNNGFPALTCVNGPECAPPTVDCSTGELLTNGLACASNGTFDLIAQDIIIPTGGNFGWAFSDQLGGTGGLMGGFVLGGVSNNVTYDADLNGILAANMLPPLAGTWVITSFVDNGPMTPPCDISVDSLIVNFDLEGPTITSLERTGADGLTVTVTGGAEPYTFLWDDANAQTTATATGLDTTGTFAVFITDAFGCQAVQTFEFSPEIIACSAGTLTTNGEISICDAAETFDLLSTNDTIPEGGQYFWNITDQLGGTGGLAGGFSITNSSPDVTWDSDLGGILSDNMLPPLSGAWEFTGFVEDADANVCSQTTESLIVNFGTESPMVTSIDFDGTDALTANATGGVAPYDYLWDDANAQTTQTAVGLAAGDYTVIISDANGCITSGEATINQVSTNSISSLQDISIAPNPNTGLFNVTLTLDQSELVNVEVLDITGQLIESQQRIASSDRFEFDLNDAAPGMYFVRIIVGDESLTQKIIVNK